MNLILIGLRGSGKTSVGRLLASRLGLPFVDLDDATAREMGAKSVADAWKQSGEPAFRQAEARALEEVLKIDGQIVALGGGTPTAPGATDALRAAVASRTVSIVYLAATAPILRARLSATDLTARPSLTGADPLSEIESVLVGRDALYRGLADRVVETDGLSVEQVVVAVAASI